jgi:hypothetical protein
MKLAESPLIEQVVCWVDHQKGVTPSSFPSSSLARVLEDMKSQRGSDEELIQLPLSTNSCAAKWSA